MVRIYNILISKILNEIIPATKNTIGYELMRMVAGNMQHVGQINYIRGLIENRIWYLGNIEENR